MRGTITGIALVAASTAACGSDAGASAHSHPPPPPTVVAPPPKPTTTLPTRAHETPSPGLCASWSAAPVALALSPAIMFVHGTKAGFSVVAENAGLAAARVDAQGRADVVQIAVEQATTLASIVPVEGLATADGGWLVAWTDATQASEFIGQVYFVRYDAGGNPVSRTASQHNTGRVLLGADAGDGTVRVAWALDSYDFSIATLPGASATSFPVGAILPTVNDTPYGWSLGRLFGTHVEASSSQAMHYREWDATGAGALDVPLALQPTTGISLPRPRGDGAGAVLVTTSSVDFEDATQATIVPVDLALETGGAPVVGTKAGAVVGTLTDVTQPDGGALGVALFEVTKGGARSPVAEVPLPTSVGLAGTTGVALTVTAAADGATYLVLINGGASVLGAVFQCTSRS